METFGFFIVLLQIILLGFLLKQLLDIDTSHAPIIAIASIMIIMMFFGMVNLLYWGRLLIFIFIPILFFLVVQRKKIVNNFREYIISPSIIIFSVACMIFILLYNVKQPHYLAWDEFSHWGPFYKSIFLNNSLHQFYDSNLVHPAYPQGQIVFYYFTAIFNSVFRESDTYIAMAIVLCACSVTLTYKIQWNNIILSILLLLLIPVFFALFTYATPYICVYQDALVGAMFGSTLLVVLCNKPTSLATTVSITLLNISMLMIKEISLVFIMIVIAVYLIRLLFDSTSGEVRERLKNKRLYLYTLIPIISSCVYWMSWKKFLENHNTGDDQFSNINPISFFEKILQGDSVISQIWNAFYEALSTWPVLLFGKNSIFECLLVFVLCSVILIIAMIRIIHKYDVTIIVGIMPLFFLLYLFVIFYTYVSHMTLREALACASLQRYLSSFFIAWAMLLVQTFLLCNKNGTRRIVHCIGIFTLVVLATMSAHINGVFVVGHTREVTGRKVIDEVTESIEAFVDADSRIWVIAQGEDGAPNESVYMYQLHYTLLPAHVFLNLPWNIGDEQYNHIIDIDSMQETIMNNGVTHVVVYKSNELLVKNFSDVFSDQLNEASKNDKICVYKVKNNKNNYLQLELQN